jgi:GH43 family beta-xylosidase
LSTAEKKVVFTPPANTAYSKALWAPEIHFLKKKWYSLKRKWYVYLQQTAVIIKIIACGCCKIQVATH